MESDSLSVTLTSADFSRKLVWIFNVDFVDALVYEFSSNFGVLGVVLEKLTFVFDGSSASSVVIVVDVFISVFVPVILFDGVSVGVNF